MDVGWGDKKFIVYVNEKYILLYIGIIIVCYLVRWYCIINVLVFFFLFVK